MFQTSPFWRSLSKPLIIVYKVSQTTITPPPPTIFLKDSTCSNAIGHYVGGVIKSTFWLIWGFHAPPQIGVVGGKLRTKNVHLSLRCRPLVVICKRRLVSPNCASITQTFLFHCVTLHFKGCKKMKQIVCLKPIYNAPNQNGGLKRV